MSRDRLTPVLFAWNDLLLSLLACLLVAAFLISVQKKQEETKETDRSAGNISIYVFWPDGIDADIDTHLRDPDGEHVYFSHKSGKIWSLLRDDLGSFNDVTDRNYENAYARGAPAGEYIVNVQAYRSNAAFPITVDAELRITPDLDKSPVTFKAKVTLDRVGDEATLFRFSIDGEGRLVPGSVNSQFVKLAGEDK